MESESQILQEKALLLITRERELNALRNKHQRLLNWLALSQSLPQVVDPKFTLAEIASKFLGRIISSIKLQRVLLLELGTDGLAPLGSKASPYPPLSAEALAQVRQARSGMTNEPSSHLEQALAEALKLHRFLWYRVDACSDKTLLLVGGFDLQRGQSYMPFDQEDAEHFAHAGQHFESLLRNVLLLNELERDKQRLERFNEELEMRVRSRTLELAQANEDIGRALASLREKDRRLGEDLAQARAFQQRILPVLPRADWIEFGSIYRALDMVGGDLFDVAELSPERYRVFVADATGHGVQASLRTIVIKLEYDRLKFAHSSLESLLSELNQRLVGTYAETEVLCTACCCDISLTPAGATLHYVNAAHPPVYRVGEDFVSEIYEGGPFLGLCANFSLHATETEIRPEECVVMATDGMLEQSGSEGRLFDFPDALQRSMTRQRTLPEGLTELCASFDEFRGSVAQEDDVTLVAARLLSR